MGRREHPTRRTRRRTTNHRQTLQRRLRARNTALPTVEAEYLLKLDADDVLNPEGVAATIHQLEKNPDAGWAAANMLIHGTGERTEHWANTPETYPEGTLAGLWTVPFPLHPGAVIYRTDRVLQAAGWPALNSAETWGCSCTSQKTPKGCGYPTYSSTTANGTPKKANKNTPPNAKSKPSKPSAPPLTPAADAPAANPYTSVPAKPHRRRRQPGG